MRGSVIPGPAAILIVALFFAIAPLASADSHGAHPRTAVIVLENREFDEVVGSPEAPYFNHLVERGALATNFYGLLHPSLPNYLGLLAGSTFGITDDCTDCLARGANLATQLAGAGVSWRAYMGGMPTSCYAGPDCRGIRQTTQPVHVFPVDHRPAPALQSGRSGTLAAPAPEPTTRCPNSSGSARASATTVTTARRPPPTTICGDGCPRSCVTSGPTALSRSPTTRAPAMPVAADSPPEGASRPSWSAPGSRPAYDCPIPTRSTPCWRRSRTASTSPGFGMRGSPNAAGGLQAQRIGASRANVSG